MTFSPAMPGIGGLVGVEIDGARGGAGGCGGAPGDESALGHGLVAGLLVEAGDEQTAQLLRLNSLDGFDLGDKTLFGHVHGGLDGRGGGALGVSGLKDEEAALLNGELDVLNVPVVGFQLLGEAHELLVCLRVSFLHHGDRLGSANAGDNVFALGVGEVLSVDAAGAGGGVTGEEDAGAAVGAGVAEDHGHDVDGGAVVVGDAAVVAVLEGAGVVPAFEDG